MEGKIKYTLSLVILAILATGCTAQHSGSASPSAEIAEGQHTEVAHGTRTFPGFSVSLTLSERAKKTLDDSRETVVVAGYVTGFPKPGTPKNYVSDMGEIGLGQVRREVPAGRNVSFNEIPLRRDALDLIDIQGPQLLINVFSGRKSSENNLLDCTIYEGPLKDAHGRSIPISCKLIGE